MTKAYPSTVGDDAKSTTALPTTHPKFPMTTNQPPVAGIGERVATHSMKAAIGKRPIPAYSKTTAESPSTGASGFAARARSPPVAIQVAVSTINTRRRNVLRVTDVARIAIFISNSLERLDWVQPAEYSPSHEPLSITWEVMCRRSPSWYRSSHDPDLTASGCAAPRLASAPSPDATRPRARS